jgi:membrane peptidoglycan carboxypeptidase
VPPVSCNQTISKETARGVNYATQEVIKRGSGQLLEFGDIPMAGKTGTNDQRSQTWFMGYNSGMVTASWIGNWKEGNTSLSGLQIGGRVYPEIDGSLIAGPSWSRFMQQIPGLYVGTPFADPPSSMINGSQRGNTRPTPGSPSRPTAPASPGTGGTNAGGTGTDGSNGGTTGASAETGDTGNGSGSTGGNG